MTISKKNAGLTRGRFDRDTLTKVITDYIYAYLHTSFHSKQVVPTLMFILSDAKDEDRSPIAVPFNIGEYGMDSLEGFTALLLEQYPSHAYGLEMVLYARFDPDFQMKTEYKIMFGARDIGGSSVHSVYQYQQGKKHDELLHHKMKSPYFDQWITKDKITDDYLRAAVSTYYSMISLRRARAHVK